MKRLVAAVLLVTLVGGCTASSPSSSPSADRRPVPAQPLRARAAHTATLLPDGRVLLAGGCAVDGCTTSEVEPSSEFYVPGRGFVPGPPMVHPRSSHTATLLPDGRVLIVGGWAREGTSSLAEAEMFDPATGARTSGPAMPQPRHAATSIVLPNGDILITGGQDRTGHGLSTTVIYHPGSGVWRPGPRMVMPRFKHAITIVEGDRVMVLGGTTDDITLLASTEILDLTTNTFTLGPAMSTPRYKFPDAVVRTTAGHLVVAGGTQVDVLAPDGRSFRAITTGAARRWFPTATALPDGTVLIVGGYDERIRVLADAQIIIKAGP
ncbi:MAG: hypothetical protein IRY92_01785 [Dactylosporangium sp.]|nr:hypothetical protein [Dactylosporangium sp.]